MHSLDNIDRKEGYAIVLLSGGLDSTTTLAIAQNTHANVNALIFEYGQRHKIEIDHAIRIAKIARVNEYKLIRIDLNTFGQSALTEMGIPVPKGRSPEQMTEDIPVTYVPGRNTIFLSYAAAWADALWQKERNVYIYTGVNALDYSGYPDCRLDYIRHYEEMINLGTRIGSQGGRIKIVAPLIHKTKEEIINTGDSLKVDYSLTISCYEPNDYGHACGNCDSCQLRAVGFEKTNVPDPTKYYV